MEIWDIYDENRMPIKFKQDRKIELLENEYYVGVGCWIINEDNKILITKRHPNKIAGNTWENPGGALDAYESSERGIIREVKEETNIKLTYDDLQIIDSCKLDKCFFDTYIAKINMKNQNIILQVNETINYKFVTFDELDTLMHTNQVCDIIKERYFNNREFIYQFIQKSEN